MVTVTSTPRKTQGRARGLLLVWKRELEQKLQNEQLFTRMWKGETLKIMIERMTERRPGDQQTDLRLTWN